MMYDNDDNHDNHDDVKYIYQDDDNDDDVCLLL